MVKIMKLAKLKKYAAPVILGAAVVLVPDAANAALAFDTADITSAKTALEVIAGAIVVACIMFAAVKIIRKA
jgi:hypothetical protein